MRPLLLGGLAAVGAFTIAAALGAAVGDIVTDSDRTIALPERAIPVPLLQPADSPPDAPDALRATGLFGPADVAASWPFADITLTPPIPPGEGVPDPGTADDLPILDVLRGFEDPCAEGADDCPGGEAGTIGGEAAVPPPLAIRASPRLSPCPGTEGSAADAFVDVSTNTPAEVSIAYPAVIGAEGNESVLRHVAFTQEQRNRWDDFFRRWGEAPPLGSPASLRYCVHLEGASKGEFWVRLDGTDVFDSHDTASVFVSVVGGRPPVVIEGRGQTTLHVEAPSRNVDAGYGVALAVVGLSETGHECRAAETDDAAWPRGVVDDPRVAFVEADVRASSPYDESYTHRFVWDVDLEEGREYVACLWWYEDEFGENAATERESYSVVAPDRMRYRMRVAEVIGIEGEIPRRSIRVEAQGCDGVPRYVPGEAVDPDPVAAWNAEPPLEFCDSGGHAFPDETTLHVSFDRRANERYEADFAVRTMTAKCPIEVCSMEYTQLYFAPIPAYTEITGLCGSGFWECDPPEETVTPGWVLIEVERYDGPRTGVLEWVVGPAEGFATAGDDGPPPYARVDGARVEPVTGGVDALRVTFDADRPVQVRAVAENFVGQGCPGGQDASSDGFATSHELVLEDLCAGQDYHVTLVLTDEAGVVSVHWLYGLEDLSMSSADVEHADHQRRLSLRATTNEYSATVSFAAEIVRLDLPGERGTVGESRFTCTLWGLEVGLDAPNEVSVGDTGRCDRRDLRSDGFLALGGSYSVRANGEVAATDFSWDVDFRTFLDDGGVALTLLTNDPWVDYGEGDARPEGVEPTDEPLVLRIEVTIEELRIVAAR